MDSLVSVIVPVYNVEKFLDKCIKSIIAQTYKKLQIILVDDGSIDNSGCICDKYATIDDRIIVVHQKNRGLSGARNRGLEIAKGEYIYFIDSDDWIEKSLIEDNLDLIIKYDLDMVIFGYYKEDVNNRKKCLQGNKEWSTKEIIDKLINVDIEPCVWNKLYRRKVLHNVKFPIGRNVEDLYVLGNILMNCSKIKCNEVCYYHYNRLNNESITKSRDILKESYELFLSYKRLFFWSGRLSDNSDIINNLLNKTSKYAIKSYDINLIKNLLSEYDIKTIIRFFNSIDSSKLKLRKRILIFSILNDIKILNFIDGYCNIIKNNYKNK